MDPAGAIFGHDLSHHQDGIDAGQLAARFIIARTLQVKGGRYGTTFDRMYAKHKANAQRAGKIFGSYLYLGDGETPARNAALHAQVEPDRAVPVMVDWEEGSGSVAHLRSCIDELRKLGYTVNLTYAPRWYLEEVGGSLAGLPPLCSSRYPTLNPGPVAQKYQEVPAAYWSGYGGNTVDVLQFSSAGRDTRYPNINLDCLAFRGSDQALAALFNTSPGPAVSAPDRTPIVVLEDAQ